MTTMTTMYVETFAQAEIQYRQERFLAEATSYRLAQMARQASRAERVRGRRFLRLARALGRPRHTVKPDAHAAADGVSPVLSAAAERSPALAAVNSTEADPERRAA
jgi:hypothetical protein